MSVERRGLWTYTLTAMIRCGCDKPRSVTTSAHVSMEERRHANLDVCLLTEEETARTLNVALAEPCPVCGKTRQEEEG